MFSTHAVVAALCLSLGPVLQLLRNEVRWYFSTWFDGVVSYCVAIQSFAISCVYALALVADNILTCVFIVGVRILPRGI